MTIMDSPGPYLRRTRLSGHWHSAPSWPDHVTREGFTRLARRQTPSGGGIAAGDLGTRQGKGGPAGVA